MIEEMCISLKDLQGIRIKLFQLGLMTTDKELSDKIYEALDLVEKKIEEKKNEQNDFYQATN